MRKILSILFVVVFLFSCGKNDTGDCTGDVYSYDFYSPKQIDTTTTSAGLTFQVNPGSDLVFSYIHNGPECKNLADEEYTDRLVFEVPAGTTSFNFQDAQLTNALCLFIKYAFLTTGAVKINSGYIKGVKVTDTKWDIDMDVVVGGSVGRITLKKTFNLR